MRYDWTLLDAGTIALDGGGMFGVVPRVLWEKSFPPDERNRITLAHNCLLLRPENGGKPVVIETGSGDKFDAKSKAIFGLGDRTILTALAEQNVDPADVQLVVVTHLHFDHAGGLTRLAREGETPDWTDTDGTGIRRTFPKARVAVQKREWTDATHGRSVMTRTYLDSHLCPIEPQVDFISSPVPFGDHGGHGTGLTRGDRPPRALASRCSLVGDGISVFQVPGHTWGQQAVMFEDTQGRCVVFVPDVMPTVAHVGSAYSLAYDVEPYTSTITRGWLLAEAVDNDWLLVLDHEPNSPVVKAEADGKGWYKLLPVDPSR